MRECLIVVQTHEIIFAKREKNTHGTRSHNEWRVPTTNSESFRTLHLPTTRCSK